MQHCWGATIQLSALFIAVHFRPREPTLRENRLASALLLCSSTLMDRASNLMQSLAATLRLAAALVLVAG